MNAEANKKFREAVEKADKAGKKRNELLAVRLFAFNKGIMWMHYDEIYDIWHGTDGEIYTTSCIMEYIMEDFK